MYILKLSVENFKNNTSIYLQAILTLHLLSFHINKI